MFISSFTYSKINHSQKYIGGDKYIEHVYSFKGKTNKKYLVIVEEYAYFVFVVKFCTYDRKNHPDRFNSLTNINECSRILTTIGYIMKEMVQNNPYASFGFIGSPLPGESNQNTKRYRLYSNVVSQLISPILFEQKSLIQKSAYLLLNRDNHEPDLQKKIEEMFNRIYIMDA